MSGRGDGRRATWRADLRLLGPSLIGLTLVVLFFVAAVSALGAVRAYVAGESQWSKARSNAVQHLLLYAETGNEFHLAQFEAALTVPTGDRLAREIMNKNPLDRSLARAQLIIGGNHPDDVDGMITLYRRFGDQGLFRPALQAWERGDQLLEALRQLAAQLHRQISTQGRGPEVDQAIADIRQINQELLDNERIFSESLGRASRWTENALTGFVLIAAIGLTAAAILMTRRTWREQVAHAQALAAVNDRWELAAEIARLGVYELDLSQGIVHFDAKAAALYGLGSEPVSRSRAFLGALVHEEDRQGMRTLVDEALRSGESFKTRYRVQQPDGHVRVIESMGRLDLGDPQQPRRMVGILRDVTTEDAQARMALQRDAARKVAQAQREFLSRLSHELRTPLNAILGFGQLILMDPARSLDPIQMRRVNLVLTAGRQLLKLVEDVLDLSKVEAGEMAMALQSVDLAETLRSAAILVDTAREPLNITLVDRLPQAPLWACADPHRIQQVFINLLTNACKYNHRDGEVFLEGRPEGSEVVVDIADTGIGLSSDEMAQLFQPFQRLGQTTHIEGTGLGLYIVKQLVERMGGSVQVSSHKGQGSRFTIRLPASAPPQLSG